MINILEQFKKISAWQFLSLLKNNDLELKELNSNQWRKVTSFKGNFEGFNDPIFLYEKVNGKMKISAVGIFKKQH